MKLSRIILFLITIVLFISCNKYQPRNVEDFNWDWKFYLGDDALAINNDYNDSSWRRLNLPHDWSIEGVFSDTNKTGQAGGGLPAGIGWYRKAFLIDKKNQDKNVFIEFDGIYRNSEVWINGNYLGKRPYGYSSFRYELTPYLNFGAKKNVIAVKVDNSLQPNSRWYTGSGIYRNVRLVTTNDIIVAHWGNFITTPIIDKEKALINNQVTIDNHKGRTTSVWIGTKIYDHKGKLVGKNISEEISLYDSETHTIDIEVDDPILWSIENPYLYKAVTTVYEANKPIDEVETNFGIRYFHFNAHKGFFLNGEHLKILGTCNHHDLGALGAAVNKRAIERQLEILKNMGCNAIRTAHNPPAPELLDLCDQMGFLVIDEAFDVWKKKKAQKDYHLEFEQWHRRDLQDMVKRDRNHPSVIIWSIGNEIREQFDSTGIDIANELVEIVKDFDTTRPVTCGLTENIPDKNFIYQSGALDVLNFNYKEDDYIKFPKWYPNEPILASETNSAYASRGVYNMPSDSVQKWPETYQDTLKNPNPDFTVSAYDHVHAYWGSTHEKTWKRIKKYNFMAGIFVWSGFDFIGEPVPYKWPARSSYYGVIDLAGFPKDSYYMYQSEWTETPMLHLFPHWNWKPGQMVDVWAYYNQADEVELFVNGESMGSKSKSDSVFHVMWRVKYQPGSIRAVSKNNGEIVLEKEIKTAGKATSLRLTPDREIIKADGYDVSFITVEILDKEGNLVPNADNLIKFELEGPGKIIGVDNGYQAEMNSFKGKQINAFNGKCLVIVQSVLLKKDPIKLIAKTGISESEISIVLEQ